VNEDAMKNITATSVVALLLAFTLNVADVPFAAHPAMAAPQVSQAVGKPLKEAQSMIGGKNFKGALAKLQEAEGHPNKSAYENFVIASLKGQAYAGLRDYNNAAKAMEAALATGQAQGAQSTQILKQIMAFYSQANNNAKTIETGQRYLKEVGNDADIQMALAHSYLQQRNYKQAEQMVRASIRPWNQRAAPQRKSNLRRCASSRMSKAMQRRSSRHWKCSSSAILRPNTGTPCFCPLPAPSRGRTPTSTSCA
jgi:tetratricopeptide (TPR) repeat protein